MPEVIRTAPNAAIMGPPMYRGVKSLKKRIINTPKARRKLPKII